MSADPFKIFICYAREDKTPLEELMGHLAVFERNGTAKFWYDQDITGGKDWDQEIRLNLKDADIVLLLISPSFFRSDYIHSVELTEALQRDRNGEALVVPIILNKCLWYKHQELARLQALPSEAKPVYDKSKWPEHHDGLYDVAEGVDRILDDPDTVDRRTRKKQRLKELEEVQAADHARLEAERRQREAETEAAQKKAEDETRKKVLPDMVLVKGGAFQMGSNENDNEKPIHVVSVSDFYMGKYPVTLAQFKQFIEDTLHITDADQHGTSLIWNGSAWEDKKGVNWRCDTQGNIHPASGLSHPVINVSWNDAVAYCQWLSRKTGQPWRLPTEAEWEYAARGGEKGAKDHFIYAGSNDLDEVGWYTENTNDEGTHPVGGKKPNQLGLFDMSGNVWEWCADWYGDYPSGPVSNPTGPVKGSGRVFRGGSWDALARYCRVSYRNGATADRGSGHGFRVASSPQ